MEADSVAIAGCAAAFAVCTWLMGISFFLGKYAARVDTVAREINTVFSKLDLIGDKIDRIAISSVHQCIQAERIARLEARLPQ